MNILERAYEGLFDKPMNYKAEVKYSGRFREYNAHVIKSLYKITIKLSKAWKNVDDEITIGLIQVLLNKLFSKKIKTYNIDLYNHFVKSLDKYQIGKSEDEELESSFIRVNNNFFNGTLDKPRIRWGQYSTRTLGSYNFYDNTITISRIFKGFPDLLDAVMHHELLHKHIKFKDKIGRTRFHTKQFKEMEKRYDREKELNMFLKRKLWLKK